MQTEGLRKCYTYKSGVPYAGIMSTSLAVASTTVCRKMWYGLGRRVVTYTSGRHVRHQQRDGTCRCLCMYRGRVTHPGNIFMGVAVVSISQKTPHNFHANEKGRFTSFLPIVSKRYGHKHHHLPVKNSCQASTFISQ